MGGLEVSPANQRHFGRESLANQDASRARKPLGSDYPSKKFSDFFNAYAKAINNAYGRTGSLFQHPFGRVPITSDHQFWNVIAYIHQNPLKHKFVDDFRDWKYSSYGTIFSEKPTHLKRDVVLEWFGSPQQYLDLHAQWVTEAESKWFAEDDYDYGRVALPLTMKRDPKGFYCKPSPGQAGRLRNQARESGKKTFRVWD